MKKVKKQDNRFKKSRKYEIVRLNRELPTKVNKNLENLAMWHFTKFKAMPGRGGGGVLEIGSSFKSVCRELIQICLLECNGSALAESDTSRL